MELKRTEIILKVYSGGKRPGNGLFLIRIVASFVTVKYVCSKFIVERFYGVVIKIKGLY